MMESRLIINKFDELDEPLQQRIQDFISGETTNWSIEFFSHCDGCGKQKELIRVETDGGITRICAECKKKHDEN